MKKSLIFSLFLFLTFSGIARAGVDGFYQIDKEPILKEMREKIKKLPPKQRPFAAMGLNMIKSMVMNITLNKNGTADLYVKMNFFGKTKEAKSNGTWTQSDDLIKISIKPQKNAKKPKKARRLHCKILPASRIVCNDPDKKDSKKIYFNKVQKKQSKASKK